MKLATSNLTVVRHGRLILDGLSFEAHAGNLIAVVGANGAGKSTLLSILAGIQPPSSGQVTLDGVPLPSLGGTVLARRRAYLPQNPRCEWPISVERLVALGLTPVLPTFGGLPESFQPRIDAALAACDLLPLRDQAATTLSGGELARAMLARALVGEPDLLIVDEPTSGLDPRHALEAMARLRLLADRGKLVIAAIHDLTLAARHATRVLALNAGRMAAFGTLADTLTADLVRALFQVQANVITTPHGALVDYVACPPPPAPPQAST